MSTWNERRDGNEKEIIEAFEAAGCTVERWKKVDLIVGVGGVNLLIEVKNPKARGRKKRGRVHAATQARQQKFRERWQGRVQVVETPEQARALALRTREVFDLANRMMEADPCFSDRTVRAA